MKNADIGAVLARGTGYRSASFLLKTLPHQNTSVRAAHGANKPAFVAGKKIFKTAVLRNKVRRKLRGALQPFVKRMLKDKKVLFNITVGAITTPVAELRNEVEDVLIKSGMLKD